MNGSFSCNHLLYKPSITSVVIHENLKKKVLSSPALKKPYWNQIQFIFLKFSFPVDVKTSVES